MLYDVFRSDGFHFMDAIENLVAFSLSSERGNLPAAVLERTKLAILDTLASTIAGRDAEGVPTLCGLIEDWGGAPQATVLNTGRRTASPLAALVNGVAARAWDLDDVHEQNTCHVSANIVPVAMALAEARPTITGREMLAATAVGMEITSRISGAPKLSFSETGMANSYQSGFFGAAITAARLLKLDEVRARHAMGIAYARIAGNQQGYVDGAMTVRLMQGVAPEGGLISALMAERGLTGSKDVLEGRFGYFETYQRAQYDPAVLTNGLGENWHLSNISIKPVYPCCKYTHGPIEAAVDGLAKANCHPDDITRITVKVTNREVYDLVCETRERKWNPRTVVDCQFSLAYTVAYALVHGGMSLDAVQPIGMNDARVRALMPRIEVDLDVEKQGVGRGTFPMPGVITLELRSGKQITSEVVYVKGHPRNPMSFDDVAEKMRVCSSFTDRDPGRTEELIAAIRDLENLVDAAVLSSLAAPQASTPLRKSVASGSQS
jgi:2-methylcitrate dehydratase PrpD